MGRKNHPPVLCRRSSNWFRAIWKQEDIFEGKWFDILLIIPFLQAFRAAGRIGRLFRGLKAFKSLRAFQFAGMANSIGFIGLGEIPFAARIAGEGMRGAKLGRAIPKILACLDASNIA